MKLLLDLQGAQSESRYRGIGRYSRALAKAIVSRSQNHDVHILLNSALHKDVDDLIAEFSTLLPAEKIHFFPVPGETAEQRPANEWRARSATLIRESFIADLRPDLVHVSSLFEGYVDDTVTSIGQLDVDHASAATLYDLVPLQDPARYLANDVYRRYYMRKAQSLKRSDLLLAISDYSKKEAEKFLNIPPQKIRVVYAGVEAWFSGARKIDPSVDAVLARYGIPGRFILHVGALDPRKNPDVLIEAFAKLRAQQASGCNLVFVGRLSPDEVARAQTIAGRFGLLRDDLIFTGHVTDPDLIRLYGRCEVLVFPSLHEGFGLPALEAMACGAAVLAADNTSLPEVIERTDALFDPRSANDLAGKIARVLEDRDFRTSLSAYGVERAATFTWDESARLCVDAFEATWDGRSANPVSGRGFRRRPKMAFVSPLPEDRTGIADYSANLLPELARFYDIDCIVAPETVVKDDWIIANFPLRDYGWLERNANAYDRVLYSMGNSSFHAKMFFTMPRVPGVVILHDVFLGNLIEWLCGTNVSPWELLDAELYLSHGLWGLDFRAREGTRAAIETLPMSSAIVRNSLGVVVHSQHASDLMIEHYGSDVGDHVAVIPQLRPSVLTGDKVAVRQRHDISSDDFVVCSFGLATENKLTILLIETWKTHGFGQDGRSRLVIVGGIGDDISDKIDAADLSKHNISVTGHVSSEHFIDYLGVADVAVQLRSHSRGETSRAILDCMAARLPVIANRHGSASELPEDSLILLPEMVSSADLAEALHGLRRDPEMRLALGARAHRYIRMERNPAAVCDQLRGHIERFYVEGPRSSEGAILPLIANINAHVGPVEADFAAVSRAVSVSLPNVFRPQILYDVSILAEKDARTGIQRVVRAVLQQIIASHSQTYRVEPVFISGTDLRYARSFISGRMGLSVGGLSDDLVEFGSGDIYLSVDWVPDRLPNMVGWLNAFRRGGGRVAFVVYDLLPLDQPKFFPAETEGMTRKWLGAVLEAADVIACDSRSVADDVKRYALALAPTLHRPIAIGYFHLGYDLAGSIPTQGFREGENEALTIMEQRRPFLMVGTIEPRKGHEQVLRAFRILWRRGVDVSLTIVGKEGWMVQEVASMIRSDVKSGHPIRWLQGISDEMLNRVYASSSALIVASEGEGFGLPIIEAAGHDIPIIARDLPVFREVAGEAATYFSGLEPERLAEAIEAWLRDRDAGALPDHTNLHRQTWAEATSQLLDVVLGRTHQHILLPKPIAAKIG